MTMNLYLVVAFSLAVASSVTATEEDIRKPVTVLIDQVPRGFVYRVDSVQVPRDKLMEVFRELMLAPDDRNRRIAVLLHEEAPFRMLVDVRGFLHHVGFLNLKYYYFTSDKRMMAEIGLSTPAIPFANGGTSLPRR